MEKQKAKEFLSIQLKTINNKPWEDILRNILFQSKLDWNIIIESIHYYFPEVKI